ncbi:hypothetical protein [Pseudomonas sp. LS1212]|uniref:hypothetical protein n=1 Tax=Pseudomonas sp. LS1212 TaxID=2972478 RepID=UPI0038CD338F
MIENIVPPGVEVSWCPRCQTSTVKRCDMVRKKKRRFHLSLRERAAGSIGPR